MQHYFTSVQDLSSEELSALSGEMYEAFARSGGDEVWWSDAEAEQRYDEMLAEIHRRWLEALTPEEQARWRAMTNMSLRVLAAGMDTVRVITRMYEGFGDGSRIGDKISIRRPEGTAKVPKTSE